MSGLKSGKELQLDYFISFLSSCFVITNCFKKCLSEFIKARRDPSPPIFLNLSKPSSEVDSEISQESCSRKYIYF